MPSLTNSSQSFLKVAGELGLDGIVDVVPSQELVRVKDGRQLRERARAQHRVEDRLVCAQAQLTWKGRTSDE